MAELKKSLSIVLPCFNPPIGWEKVVVNTVKSLEDKIGTPIELIIVDDGSTKNNDQSTFDFVDDSLPNAKVFHHAVNQGKGQALRTGVAQATGDWIIFTDIDFPYTEESLIKVFEGLQSGSQVVLGHRNKEYYQHTPPGRKLISKVLRFSLKSFLKLPTDDSQCGIKGFDQIGKQVFLSTTIDRFLFDLEFIKLISKKKVKSQNVEVKLKPGVVFSKVNMKILAKESLNFAKILFTR